MPPRSRRAPKTELVTLKLAHPLREGNPFTGVAGEVNEEVELPRNRAMALIGSGYAQVDPQNQQAVVEALGLDSPADVTALDSGE